ncbi:MAG: dehydrogenase [Cyclobacteriaceae bacterium]|nr:dehydrogenase [Cyclobacteriaceae bacterium]
MFFNKMIPFPRTGLITTGLLGILLSWGCGPAPNQKEGPSPPLSPEAEAATFQVDQGLTVQLVAAEPMVQDPVVFTFDEDGRLWVVEMRGFMPDIDGNGEELPTGRVSVLEDTDGDGQMDKSHIFLDSLILPRAIALVPGGALIAENEALWMAHDKDGDLKADSKVLIDPDYAGSPMPEHAGNGLLRGIDNWYYNAKSRLRYKLIDGEWVRDSTEFRGQWGISHDNKGRLYYNYNWSQLHADLVPPNYLNGNKNHTSTSGIDHGLTINKRVYPIRPTPAINRGYIPGNLDADGKLLEFTAACSPFVYRGHALPAEYFGNAFVCEPSGNLIKRNVVQDDGIMLSAYDPTPGTEFLASTDERFRPVHLAAGPDGTLYIADMYRGLIEHGAYVTPYLREQTLQRKLDQPINMGRIWRIVPIDHKPYAREKLSEAQPVALVAALSHPNGWHRDMAQRLIVERDLKTLADPLAELALHGGNIFGRLHALWAMEGLNITNTNLLFQLLDDPVPLIATTALRLLEPFAKNDPKIRTQLAAKSSQLIQKAPKELHLQLALSARVLNEPEKAALLRELAIKYTPSALFRDAILSSLEGSEFAVFNSLTTSTTFSEYQPEREIFLEMFTSAIVKNGKMTETEYLLTFIDKPGNEFNWQEKAILNGILTQGRMKGKLGEISSAPKVLKRSYTESLQSRINNLAFYFEWPGHTIDTASVKKKNILNPNEQKMFVSGRQQYLTNCAGCHGTDGAGLSRSGPPLAKSEWVIGDAVRLSLIVLHGIEGPLIVDGKRYDAPEILPVMPGHFTLDDGEIATILTYIRNEWGNDAGAVSGGIVGRTRHHSQGNVMPWTADKLNRHIDSLNALEEERP